MKVAKINIAKFQKIIFYSVIIFSIVIRAFFLNHKTLWLDEAYSVLFCKSNLTKAMDFIISVQGNFAGYWIIIHPLLKFFKNVPIEITLRTPSLIADILAMFVFYKIVRKLLDEKEAKLATIFYSLHPVLIWHSLDGRFYSIYLLFCLLSVYLLINIKGKQKGFLLWSLVTGIIPYFHFYGYFFIFLLFLALFIFFPTLIAESRIKLILKFFPVFFIMGPSLVLFYFQSQNISTPSLILSEQRIKDSLLFIALSLFGNFHQEYLSFYIPLILFPVTLIIFVLSDSKFKNLYIVIFLLILLLPSITHYFTKIFFHSRFVIFSIPFFIFAVVDLISKKNKILKNILIVAFILNYLWVDYATLTVNSARPFRRNELENIDKLPGNFLFVPGYFVTIFDSYNLLKNRSKYLCLPDISNKKDLSIMLPPGQTEYLPYLIPQECSALKESIEKEEIINLIFSPFLKTRELMSECIINVTKSFKVTHVNELASGIKIIQLQK